MRRLVLVLGMVLSLVVQADVVKREDVSRGRIDRTDPELVQLYVSLSELSLHEQRAQMWALSSKTKAALWRYNIDQYIESHPELCLEDRAILHEGILLITSPGWFDIQKGSFGYESKSQALAEYKRRVQEVFQPEAIFDIFLRLGTEPPSIEPAAPPVPSADAGPPSASGRPDFAPVVNYDGCNCADWDDCIPWFWSSCKTSYCEPVVHCGWYGDEMCMGRCK